MYLFDFSVIVLCYNPKLDQLINTLNSIIKQKEVSFEIIICDDCSKFDYRGYIEDWEKKNKVCKLVFSSQNEGTIKNFLKGIRIAQGKYIKPISPGDYLFDPLSLAEYKKIFLGEKADILFSDSIYYSNKTIVRKRQYPANDFVFHKKGQKTRYCIYGYYFLGATICSKRELVELYLTNVCDRVRYLEDFSMMTQAYIDEKKIIGIKKPLIWYEFGSGISTNTRGNNNILKDSEAVCDFLLEKYPQDKYVLKMVKIRKILKQTFFVKLFKLLFLFPKFFVYKFISLFYKRNQYNANISQMEKIIGE